VPLADAFDELGAGSTGREPSRRALPVLVDRLQADGYRLVTVRDLLARER
jgi:hypothetical protein